MFLIDFALIESDSEPQNGSNPSNSEKNHSNFHAGFCFGLKVKEKIDLGMTRIINGIDSARCVDTSRYPVFLPTSSDGGDRDLKKKSVRVTVGQQSFNRLGRASIEKPMI